jgi:hypothetical protein
MSREKVEIAGHSLITGYPIDDKGNLLDPNEIENGEAPYLTDPYENITYAVGNSDDFVCFDYAIMDRCDDGVTRICLDATINSETGGFIQEFESWIAEVKDAPGTALGMIDRAHDWCMECGEIVEHDAEGYNQCANFFYYEICLEVWALMGLEEHPLTNGDARHGSKAMKQLALKLEEKLSGEA